MLFTTGWKKEGEGFVNLHFLSIPSAYGGKVLRKPYPDQARHELLISPEFHGRPFQHKLYPEQYKRRGRDIFEQLQDARCYLKANAKKILGTRSTNCWLKIMSSKFMVMRYDHKSIYVPFFRHVDEHQPHELNIFPFLF